MRLISIVVCMAVGVFSALTAHAQESTPAASPPAEGDLPAHPLPRPAAVIAPPPGKSQASAETPPVVRHKHSPKIVGGTGHSPEPSHPASSSDTQPPK